MEQTLNDFIEQASQVLRPAQKDPIEGFDPDEPMTIATYLKLKQQQEAEERQSAEEKARADILYGRGYEKELHNIGDDVDEETHIQVMKMVTDTKDLTYSSKSSKDPVAAAQINYNKALRAIQNKTAKKPNLKNDKNLPPKSSKTKTSVKTEPEIELDAAALDYIKRVGMTEEEARKLLAQG